MISPESSQFGPEAYDEAADDPNPPPRPNGIGSRRLNSGTFTISNGPHVIAVESRVGLDLATLLADEGTDYRRALQSAVDDGEPAATFARGEEDRSVWTAAGELVALLRADRESGSLLVLEIRPGVARARWRILVDAATVAPRPGDETEGRS